MPTIYTEVGRNRKRRFWIYVNALRVNLSPAEAHRLTCVHKIPVTIMDDDD